MKFKEFYWTIKIFKRFIEIDVKEYHKITINEAIKSEIGFLTENKRENVLRKGVK